MQPPPSPPPPRPEPGEALPRAAHPRGSAGADPPGRAGLAAAWAAWRAAGGRRGIYPPTRPSALPSGGGKASPQPAARKPRARPPSRRGGC